jgi:hypothetical protein
MIEIYQWRRLIGIISAKDVGTLLPKRCERLVHGMWADDRDEFTYLWLGQ